MKKEEEPKDKEEKEEERRREGIANTYKQTNIANKIYA